MKSYHKQIKALENFKRSWLELSHEFDNDTMWAYYPFKESFDELEISKWVEKSIDSCCLAENRKNREAFTKSRVLLPKELLNKVYDISIEDYCAYLYLESYVIEVTVNGFLVTFCNESKIFTDLNDAEEFLFDYFVKHEHKQ